MQYRSNTPGTDIEIHIKTFHEFKLDLKICWFAVTQPGVQEIRRSKKVFDTQS